MTKLEDKTPRRRRGEEETSAAKGKGWGALAGRKKEVENREYEDRIREFWLSDGESAIVQFLSEEPYCMEGHMIKHDGSKTFTFTPCQLSHQRHCLMCREGIKKTWKAAFKILDYRGNWDKDRKRHKRDEKIEKVWYVGQKLAEQIKSFIDKRGKPLTEVVFEVTRSGSGKSTTYNLEVAFDSETDTKVPVFRGHEEKYPSLDEICKPLTDEQLESKGFSALENDDD